MNVLVVIGDCLTVNSSANLCHLAYLNGLLAAGHQVELLCAADDAAGVDRSLQLPKGIGVHAYGVSLYEKMSHLKKNTAGTAHSSAPVSAQTEVCSRGVAATVKAAVRGLYGVYGPSQAWHNRAVRFSSDTVYDCMLSVSCPFISHYTAYTLLKRGRVNCKRWIQVWEDPWYADIAYDSAHEACRREEEFLCAVAEEIVYVSPITLAYQRKLYPAHADKMRFVPVPSYYNTPEETLRFADYVYGYFGDFMPEVRNLTPFYKVATARGERAFICGNPDGYFPSTETVGVYARMELTRLHEFEEQCNVLVFLCNLKGGQIPGKIYQYSATEKLILFILDGAHEEIAALRDYFEPLGRYVFCENTQEDIARAMGEIAAGRHQHTAKKLDCFAPSAIVKEIFG